MEVRHGTCLHLMKCSASTSPNPPAPRFSAEEDRQKRQWKARRCRSGAATTTTTKCGQWRYQRGTALCSPAEDGHGHGQRHRQSCWARRGTNVRSHTAASTSAHYHCSRLYCQKGQSGHKRRGGVSVMIFFRYMYKGSNPAKQKQNNSPAPAHTPPQAKAK